MCVCMYAYLCMHVHISTGEFVHTCVYMYLHTCEHIFTPLYIKICMYNMYTHLCPNSHVNVSVGPCIYMHARVCMCLCTCMPVFILTHTHIHAHKPVNTCTNIYTPKALVFTHYTHGHLFMCASASMCVYPHLLVFVCIYACIYTCVRRTL